MQLQSNGYIFKPHEMPIMPGSPAIPSHSSKRKLLYVLIALYLTFVAGLQNGLLSVTIPQVRGEMALTIVEGGWVQVAYFIGYSTFGALLFKVRQHFGVQKFIRWTLWLVLLSNLLQVFFRQYHTEVFARFMLGVGASGFFSMAIFYGLQALTGQQRLLGIGLLSGLMQIVPTLSQLIYPSLYQDGDMQAVFFFQFSATLIGVGLIRWFTLPPGFTQPAINWLDLLSFALFMCGIGFLCAFLVQGNVVWWTTPWLGWLLAAGFGCLGLMYWIEIQRKQPMIYWRWVTGQQVAMLLFMAMLTRLFSTEQAIGATSILTLFGLNANQLTTYYIIIWLSSLAGLVLSLLTLKVHDIRRSMVIALFGLSLGAYLDIGVGSQTRAEQFYLSQSIIAFSSFYFIAPAFIEGFLRAMAAGMENFLSFLALFSATQTLGSLIGSAGFNAYITVQGRLHLQNLAQQITAIDPQMTPQAVEKVIKNANVEATLLAYNDLFELISLAAGAAATVGFVIWLYRRIHKIDILAKEMLAIKAKMAQRS